MGRHYLRLAAVALFIGLVNPLHAVGQATPSAAPVASTTTALLVSAIHAPQRVTASDGKVHLEYDLLVTNAFTDPVTLTTIDVLTPDNVVLLHLTGDALRALTTPVLGHTPTDVVPYSGAVVTMLDVVIPPDLVPARLTHRVAYALPAHVPSSSIIGSLLIEGPTVDVDPFLPVVIAPPLRGAGWLNGSGCCVPSPHRLGRLVVDGARIVTPETFAIDWLQLNGDRLVRGDGLHNKDYFGYGADVLAVADATVVFVQDGEPEQTPNQPVAGIREPLDYAGNQVTLELSPGVYANYAHFQPGSIRVHVGEKVTVGQVLGLLGNSGNSSAPHLHFGLSDGPQILTSNSLPFVIHDWTLAGIATLNSTATGVQITGTPAAQTDTLPLEGAISGFP